MNSFLLKAQSLIDSHVQAGFHIENSIVHTTPLHFHDFHEIFIITAGKCIHRVNDKDQILSCGAMVFIRPGDSHYYAFYNNEDCQFININFYSELLEHALDYIGDRIFAQNLLSQKLPPCLQLSPDDMKAVIGKGEQFHLYSTFDKPKSKILAKGFLIDALTHFYLAYKGAQDKSIPAWFDALLFQMQKKENFNGGIERLYAMSGKSKGHLNRIFKQCLDTTPTDYINRLKLNYARNLLLTTNLEIMDVAFEAGFANLSHFYHLFRSIFGTTPGAIRHEKNNHDN